MSDSNGILAGVEIHGMTRGAFILRGALAAAAAYGAGAAGPYVERALAQSNAGDIAILNFALTLEYVESTFYKAALATAKLRADLKSLAALFGQNEQAHVQTLTQAVQQIGAKPVTAPRTSFPVRDDASFLRLATMFEETGVSAYNGAAPGFKSPDLLVAAGSIVQVEARHAAALHNVANQDPSPRPFDRALSPAQVLPRVKPYITG